MCSRGNSWTARGKPVDYHGHDTRSQVPSVVQRQLWLMKHQRLSQPAAYDIARREFYRHRHLEDIRRRVAKEEALHVGAYFSKGPLQIGMEIEDAAWEDWKSWARTQIEDEEAQRAQMFSGPQMEDDVDTSLPELEAESAAGA